MSSKSGKFAASTDVPVERSRAEIEAILQRYGAEQFMSGWSNNRAVIAFHCKGRQIRFTLELPSRTEVPEKMPGVAPQYREGVIEQRIRQRWRALALCIKAKLEAVETGISQFEEEFLANIVMPDKKTLAEHALPVVEAAYASGKMQPLLPHF